MPPGVRPEALTQDAILLVPPDLRPLVLLDSGNFATHDVNDLYRRVINRRNRLVKLVELKAPETIVLNEQRMLQETVDSVHANMLLPSRHAVRGSQRRRLVCCLNMIAKMPSSAAEKWVDWVGRARAIVDPALPPGAVTLPEAIVRELWLKEDEPVLLTGVGGDGSFVAALPRPGAAPVIRLSASAFAALGLAAAEAAECVVHRPITSEARAKARRLLAGDPGGSRPARDRTSWLDAGSERGVIRGLLASAWAGTPARLESPAGLLVGGPGCVDFVEPEAPPRREPEWQPVAETS